MKAVGQSTACGGQQRGVLPFSGRLGILQEHTVTITPSYAFNFLFFRKYYSDWSDYICCFIYSYSCYKLIYESILFSSGLVITK